MSFDQIVTNYGFKENVIDQCIYMKVSGSNYIFLVLYINDIMLTSNDSNLLNETNSFLFGHFDMKDLGEASYVLGIQILRDMTIGVLRLSKRLTLIVFLKDLTCNLILLGMHQL